MEHIRRNFDVELDELRIQVEVMAIRVDESVRMALEVIDTGDREIASRLVAADDEIDEMHTSLTARCYDLLVRESPVASDFRLVVSVITVLSSLERVGDLCLRIAKQVDEIDLVRTHPALFAVLHELAISVRVRFTAVQSAWASRDLSLLLAAADPGSDNYADPLLGRILELEGPDAVRVAVSAFAIGRALDRIGDHSRVMSARLQYMVTGDPVHLAEEIA